jgi:hypothetical protein
MSNDDLGLSDLSPNIIDDWEKWASDRPDRETKQGANERKIVALCRAVRQLRSDLTRARTERDAARENHLKVMKQRDAAFSLLDSFRNAHTREHSWGGGVCHLCLAAEKMTKP